MGSRWSAEALLSGERLRGPGGRFARRAGIAPAEGWSGSDIDDPPALLASKEESSVPQVLPVASIQQERITIFLNLPDLFSAST